MERRILGRSALSLSPIVLGTWAIGGWMWGGSDEKEAREAIIASIDRGVTSIDTAPVYGMGHSEEIVGKAIQGRREQVQILTKCGLRWDGQGALFFMSQDERGRPLTITKECHGKAILQECEASLRRLGVDYIDLYQIHWPDEQVPIEESWMAMKELLESGKVKAIGVSNFDVDWMRRAHLLSPIASNQVPYSVVRRGIEREVLPYCLEEEIGILAYSPLERGLFTDPKTHHPLREGDHRKGLPLFSPENREKAKQLCAKLLPLADHYHLSISQLVIQWTVRQPGITAAIVGARTPEQAIHNSASLDRLLTEQELDQVASCLAPLASALAG